MKLKTLLLSALLLLCGMAHADDLARVMLMHQGQTTIFSGDKISEALTQAVDGDTLYLSEGRFPSFTISKKVFVRGAGSSTLVAGNVEIGILDAPELTIPVLEGLVVNGTLILSKPCTNLTVRRCKFYAFTNNANSMPNALIDRCWCNGNFNITEYMTDFTVRNCDIAKLVGTNSMNNRCNFVNCGIYGADASTASGRFVNCVMWNCGAIRSSMLLNTLVYTYNSSVGSGTLAQDCYYDSSDSTLGTDTFSTKGYKGLDGTIVGEYGGSTPYGRLSPEIPREIAGTIAVDNENKKLNVEMEISPN